MTDVLCRLTQTGVIALSIGIAKRTYVSHFDEQHYSIEV